MCRMSPPGGFRAYRGQRNSHRGTPELAVPVNRDFTPVLGDDTRSDTQAQPRPTSVGGAEALPGVVHRNTNQEALHANIDSHRSPWGRGPRCVVDEIPQDPPKSSWVPVRERRSGSYHDRDIGGKRRLVGDALRQLVHGDHGTVRRGSLVVEHVSADLGDPPGFGHDLGQPELYCRCQFGFHRGGSSDGDDRRRGATNVMAQLPNRFSGADRNKCVVRLCRRVHHMFPSQVRSVRWARNLATTSVLAGRPPPTVSDDDRDMYFSVISTRAGDHDNHGRNGLFRSQLMRMHDARCEVVEHTGEVGLLRVMVADDHRVLVDALAARLDAEADIVVVGKTYSSVGARSMARSLRPDVLLLDVEFGDGDGSGDGLDIARRLQQELPATQIVMLTAHDDTATASAAVLAGVSGYVAKDATSSELIAAIRLAASGDAWIQPRILRRVLDDLAHRRPRLTADQERVARLTDRETEILGLMVAGMDRAAIARRLYLSTNTVRTHVRNLFTKLGVNSSLEAVALGMRAGLGPAGTQARADRPPLAQAAAAPEAAVTRLRWAGS